MQAGIGGIEGLTVTRRAVLIKEMHAVHCDPISRKLLSPIDRRFLCGHRYLCGRRYLCGPARFGTINCQQLFSITRTQCLVVEEKGKVVCFLALKHHTNAMFAELRRIICAITSGKLIRLRRKNCFVAVGGVTMGTRV